MPSCASFLARSRSRATQRALARCGRAPRRLPTALGSQVLLRARPAAGRALWSDVVGVATRLLRARRRRGPWAVDWAYIHGFFCMVGSSDFGVTVGAALASSSRGSSWWLGARWLAVGGGTGRWRAAERTCVFIALWRRACCGAYPLFIARARFEFSRSRVFIASFGRRGRPSPLQLRATCCRIRLRLFRHAATSVLRGLPAFLSLGRVLCVSGVFIVALGLGGRWGLLRHRGPGGGWHLRRPPRRRGGGRWSRRLVWADGAVARARLWRFFLSPCGLRCTSSRHSAGRQCAYGRRCALQRG